MKPETIADLNLMDVFILKAIVSNDYAASRKRIIQLVTGYWKTYRLGEVAGAQYFFNRLVWLTERGFIVKRKGPPNLYAVALGNEALLGAYISGFLGLMDLKEEEEK